MGLDLGGVGRRAGVWLNRSYKILKKKKNKDGEIMQP